MIVELDTYELREIIYGLMLALHDQEKVIDPAIELMLHTQALLTKIGELHQQSIVAARARHDDNEEYDNFVSCEKEQLKLYEKMIVLIRRREKIAERIIYGE